jgi:hypothetical protein
MSDAARFWAVLALLLFCITFRCGRNGLVALAGSVIPPETLNV